MTNFDERQKGFEAGFKHDQDLLFRIAARRNKLFGLWAAERLGLSASAAETYAQAVVAADLQAPGDEDVIEKVRFDLASRGVELTLAQLQTELMHAAEEARKQLVPGQ